MTINDIINEVNVEFGNGQSLAVTDAVKQRTSYNKVGEKDENYTKTADLDKMHVNTKSSVENIKNYLKKKGVWEKVAAKQDFKTTDLVFKADGSCTVNFDAGGSITVPAEVVNLKTTVKKEEPSIREKFKKMILGEDVLEEGKPTLQRDIMLKAKPFLKKYGIDFDLSNYQNDGYLKAGGYKFWFDDEERDFRTNAPNYAGKGFADIRELLAYALDIKEAEKEHRNTWGLQTYLARSKPNKGYSNNLYKKVVSEGVLEESELSRAKADVAYRELEKKIKEKGWAINQYMNDRKERSRLSPNEMFVNKGNIGGQLYILDLKTGIAKPEGEINVGRDQELMTLFKAARHHFQKNDGNGNYPVNTYQTRLFSKSEYEKGKKYEREGKYNPAYDLSDNRYKSNDHVRLRDRNYASKALKEEVLEEDVKSKIVAFLKTKLVPYAMATGLIAGATAGSGALIKHSAKSVSNMIKVLTASQEKVQAKVGNDTVSYDANKNILTVNGKSEKVKEEIKDEWWDNFPDDTNVEFGDEKIGSDNLNTLSNAKLNMELIKPKAPAVSKMSVVTEGSHHSKYPPAINYKHVNNYLIKARKAIKAGNIEEAEKWAWEANITMHEDEMQGPGVAADKNAYNIFHKQLSNIHSAILAAKKSKGEI